MGELILHVEIGLEEKVLRYKLPLKDHLSLEWSWREDPSRGGMECTILTHIIAGTNVISIQNKKNPLHWKALDSTMAMNNDVDFPTSAHNLLLKLGLAGEDRQAHRSRIVNIQASPQAARKKRFTWLDLDCFRHQTQPHSALSLAQKTQTGNGKRTIFRGALNHMDCLALKPP
jgi:hypothetical protein